jgi:site-specific DNA-methyltransferase (adenine-specific)
MSPPWDIRIGDCLGLLPALEDRPRLIVSDPPYNERIDYGAGFNDARTPKEYVAWCGRWIQACYDALADDGSFWLIITHRWSPYLFHKAKRAGFHWRQTVTWYEPFGQNCTRKFNRCSRPILWFTKHRKRFVFNADAPEVRRPSDRQAIYRDKRGKPEGKLWDDVWGIKPPIPRLARSHKKERIPGFPTQLPIRLLRPIVAGCSDVGDLVIDPFCGSATTGAACLELGRRFIGLERSETFANRARERLHDMRTLWG